MDVLTYFIKPIQNKFALVARTRDRKEVSVETGSKAYVKGRFQYYASNRDDLQRKVSLLYQ